MPGPIVVGVDFSPASRKAMEAAAGLAQDLGTSVVLVHALPPRVGPGAGRADAIRQVLAEADMDDVVELATDWAVRLREQGVDVEPVAREGKPGELLFEVAREYGAALVVVGHHGWGAVKRFLLGSTAKHVLDHATLPVLVVPETSR